jgi:hypothetical protein
VTDDQTSDDRPDDSASDSPLGRTDQATNAEAVPDPEADPDETGEAAAGQADRLEEHNRPTTGPMER